jgi:hypothetical protein
LTRSGSAQEAWTCISKRFAKRPRTRSARASALSTSGTNQFTGEFHPLEASAFSRRTFSPVTGIGRTKLRKQTRL